MPSDTEEISRLMYTYAERLDEGDFEGVAELFAEATFRSAGQDAVLRGRDQVLAVYRMTVATYDGKPATKHVTTNLIVELDGSGDSASARSYFTVLQACSGLPLQPIVAGRYHDRFVRRDGRWRFADRLIFVDLVGDVSRHLGQDLLGG